MVSTIMDLRLQDLTRFALLVRLWLAFKRGDLECKHVQIGSSGQANVRF